MTHTISLSCGAAQQLPHMWRIRLTAPEPHLPGLLPRLRRIHRKGRRNKPLSEREKQGNKTRSSVRVRVEHVFGAQSNDMGGTLVRSVGLARAKARIGLKNLAYNMRRLVQLERLAAAV